MRYGASWEAERGVKGCAKNQRGRQAVTRVLDWADHLVAEGNRLFKDTPFKGMWVISERVVVDVDHLSTHVCTFIPAPAAQSRIFQYLAPTILVVLLYFLEPTPTNNGIKTVFTKLSF